MKRSKKKQIRNHPGFRPTPAAAPAQPTFSDDARHPDEILPEKPEPYNWLHDNGDEPIDEQEEAAQRLMDSLPFPGAPPYQQPMIFRPQASQLYAPVPPVDRSPNGYLSPFSQWTTKIASSGRPEAFIEISEETWREIQVRKTQPFRKALLDQEEEGIPLPATRGPLMLPDSHDPVTNRYAEEEPQPGLPSRTYPPDAPAHEILAGMAEDMVHVGSVMVARMRVAIGYESDAKMIHLYKELAQSLYKMHHITRVNKPKRGRGRPRKNLVKIEKRD